MEFKEYVVTLYKHEDLDEFYQDMETPGGNLYIPNRVVDIAKRRPISRNTHYWLTAEEAELLKQDPRVLDVSLTMKELGIIIAPTWSRNGNFTKTLFAESDDLNWGTYRILLGNKVDSWGIGGFNKLTKNITYNLSGKNVDILIVDGHLKQNHAEFKENVDGTGSSRVNRFNWFSLNPAVNSTPASTYDYNDDTGNADHGNHVAGIAAGNKHSLAKDANIYNISPYGDEPSLIFAEMYDYIRQWHKTKPINPNTGVKNPTVVNNSYGAFNYVSLTDFNNSNGKIIHKGITYNGPWDLTGNGLKKWEDLGFNLPPLPYVAPYVERYLLVSQEATAFTADLQDAIDDGIIIVWAAGNEGRRLDISIGPDFNNRLKIGTDESKFINRSFNLCSRPGNLQYILNVGNLSGFVNEPINGNSNKGPGVDIWAPGSGIVSAIASSFPQGDADDSRKLNGDRIKSFDGTSMAAPQVTGLVATLLELKPSFTQQEIYNYVRSLGKTNQIDTSLGTTTGNYDDIFSLQGASNLIAYAPNPSFTISVNKTTLNPSESTTYTIATTSVPDGSVLYLTEYDDKSVDNFVDKLVNLKVTVIGNRASLTRTASTIYTNKQVSTLELRTGGYDGTIHAMASTVTLNGPPPVNLPATFSISAGKTAYDEGETAQFLFKLETGTLDYGASGRWFLAQFIVNNTSVGELEGDLPGDPLPFEDRVLCLAGVNELPLLFRVKIREDIRTEGVETLTCAVSSWLNGQSESKTSVAYVSVQINDTSIATTSTTTSTTTTTTTTSTTSTSTTTSTTTAGPTTSTTTSTTTAGPTTSTTTSTSTTSTTTTTTSTTSTTTTTTLDPTTLDPKVFYYTSQPYFEIGKTQTIDFTSILNKIEENRLITITLDTGHTVTFTIINK